MSRPFKHMHSLDVSDTMKRKLERYQQRSADEILADEIYWKGSDRLYHDNYREIKTRTLKSTKQLIAEIAPLRTVGMSDLQITDIISPFK